MTIEERARHDLYTRLGEVLGDEHAVALMAHLPPTGWADVATKRDLDAHAAATKRDLDAHEAATKRDLDALTQRIDLKVEASEQRLLAAFRKELVSQTRLFVFSTIGSMATIASLAFAAARAA